MRERYRLDIKRASSKYRTNLIKLEALLIRENRIYSSSRERYKEIVVEVEFLG
jgi:hypothetical protein